MEDALAQAPAQNNQDQSGNALALNREDTKLLEDLAYTQHFSLDSVDEEVDEDQTFSLTVDSVADGPNADVKHVTCRIESGTYEESEKVEKVVFAFNASEKTLDELSRELVDD